MAAKKTSSKSAAKKIEKPVGTKAKKVDETASFTLLNKKAPSFSLEDQSGHLIKSKDLAGKPYLLYFYPKDDTPGCTAESCDFRDAIGNFRRASVTVLGVSPDSVTSHQNFASKYALPFSLLSDRDMVLAKAYGVWALKKNYGREYWGIVRSTFLIGGNGKVLAEWRGVRVKGHSAAVLEQARKAK